MTKKQFKGGQWKVSVAGLDLIFKVLCLIAKIMIYRLPARDSIEYSNVREFKEQLKELQE